MTTEELAKRCTAAVPSDADIDAFAVQSGIDRSGALDCIAIYVAKRYASREMDFNVGDAVMNHVFAYAASRGLAPKVMWSVYLAFDAGEYQRKGDASDPSAENRYTRRMIAKLLTE